MNWCNVHLLGIVFDFICQISPKYLTLLFIIFPFSIRHTSKHAMQMKKMILFSFILFIYRHLHFVSIYRIKDINIQIKDNEMEIVIRINNE